MSQTDAAAAPGAVVATPHPVLESPAYPPLVRTLAVVLVVDVLGFGLWSAPALLGAAWSTSSLVLLALAMLCIGWLGYWILNSRTRLDGDMLTQTWLWNKREHADNVASMKLVHWRWLQRIVAPRLLVRRRNGAMTWFYSADAQLLVGFAERVAERSVATMPR